MTMPKGKDVGPATGSSAIEPLLLPEQAAQILNLSESWLAKGRAAGYGPQFIKIGRAVRYSKSGLRKFIKERIQSNAREAENRNEE